MPKTKFPRWQSKHSHRQARRFKALFPGRFNPRSFKYRCRIKNESFTQPLTFLYFSCFDQFFLIEKNGEHVVRILHVHRAGEYRRGGEVGSFREVGGSGPPLLQPLRRSVARRYPLYQNLLPRCAHRNQNQGNYLIHSLHFTPDDSFNPICLS